MRDEDVMKLVKNGKLNALSILFDRYHVRLFNFFLRLIDDRDLSEDLVQNVFERIIKYRSTYREGAAVKTWIYQIARNVRVDHFRSQKWHKEEFAEIENEIDVEESSQIMMEKQEEKKALDQAIQQLPLSYREVLWLGHFEELGYKEVGEILGISVPNVKVRMHRAVKQLKIILNPSACR
ncbi:MAG: RNA polymerase sigma factor [Bacteroidota bacterium]